MKTAAPTISRSLAELSPLERRKKIKVKEAAALGDAITLPPAGANATT
jgi:hypothetical protein